MRRSILQTFKRVGRLTTGLMMLAQAALPAVALADNTPPDYSINGKLEICHRTSSITNPYEYNEVALSAIDGEGGNDHTLHTGPIFDPAVYTEPSSKGWGDIIPPYVDGDYVYPGYNWPAGQAIWENGCAVPGHVSTIRVIKKLIPENDLGRFNLYAGTGGPKVTNAGNDDSTEPIAISDGSVVVKETAYTGSSLANYTTGLTCTNQHGAIIKQSTPTGADSRQETISSSLYEPGDQIVCVFTNTRIQTTPTGSITIVKDAQPNSLQDFTFQASLDGGLRDEAFSLDDDAGVDGADDTLSNSLHHDSLIAAEHTFTEDPTDGWQLTAINCTGTNNAAVDLANRKVTVDLLTGEHVICTFVNQKEDTPPPVDYCDPAQYNIVTNPDNITAAQRADCFTVAPSLICGVFNVAVTGPVFMINGNPTPFRAQWVYDGESRDARRNFPATFTEDQNGGNVKVRYLLVGPESDYLTGTGIPNYWDNLLSQVYEVNTNCKAPEVPVDPVDEPCAAPDVRATLFVNSLAIDQSGSDLSGCKFNDANSNGVWDEGEETLSGFTFELYTCSNDATEIDTGVCEEAAHIDTAISDQNGVYAFYNLANGSYMVCEKPLDGWMQTYPVDMNGVAACWLVPIEGEDCIVNFGNKAKEPGEVLGNPTPTPEVLAETGSSALMGIIAGLSIIGCATGVVTSSRRQQN